MLKDDGLTDPDRKREIEKLVNSLPQETFGFALLPLRPAAAAAVRPPPLTRAWLAA